MLHAFRRLSFIVLSFILRGLSATAQANRTIDDTLGDPIAGTRPRYTPSIGTWEDATCTTCFLKLDPTKTMNGTWTAASYTSSDSGGSEVSIEFSFVGTAVYVFFALGQTTVNSTTSSDFFVDGSKAGHFDHDYTSRDILYNQLAFNQQDLSYDTHTMKIVPVAQDNEIVWLCFDYAMYTVPEEAIASVSQASLASATAPNAAESKAPASSKAGIIAGSVVGGVVGLSMICGAFFLGRRTARHRKESRTEDPPDTTQFTPFLPRQSSAGVILPRTSRTLDESGGQASLDSNEMLVEASSDRSSEARRRQERQMELLQQVRKIESELTTLSKQATIRSESRSTHRPDLVSQGSSSDLQAQISSLQQQINFLQEQQHSAWALGLSDERPPGYEPFESMAGSDTRRG